MKRLIVPLLALAACQPTPEASTPEPPPPTTSPAPSTSSTAPATTSTSTTTSITTTVTTVMQAKPEPVVSPQRAADGPGLASDELLACIRSHEQGKAGYRTDTGNGYYGAYQFDLPTWRSVGGTGNPAHASAEEQDARALALYESRGLAPWPTPSRMCA